MLQFIIKRIFYGFFVLLGVVIIVFLLFNILPGDPARMMMGQRADIASVESIRKELGLDRPLHVQFFGFVNDVSPVSWHNSTDAESFWFYDQTKYTSSATLFSTGSAGVMVAKLPYLGRSYQSRKAVSEIIAEAFPNTALLAVVAMSFAMVLGVIAGVFSALYRDSFFDRAALLFSVLGMSLPSFFAAVLFAWIFAFLLADVTGLNMVGSLYAVDDFGRGEYMELKNLILPAITLGIRPLAVIVELTRNSMLEVLSQDYIRTAYAKGLNKFRVITGHALKNAMNPVITAVSGWFASLMAGAVFVEYVFDWKGLGVVIVNALEQYDFPVIMGSVLFVSVILIFINIAIDIVYGWLDPRVRVA
jgi:peptide/nickel transport system permease protein